jgi:hypothetical protein
VIPFMRIVTMVMMGAICFALLLPLAIERHNTLLATGVVAIFVLYLGANVLLWLRLRPRA